VGERRWIAPNGVLFSACTQVVGHRLIQVIIHSAIDIDETAIGCVLSSTTLLLAASSGSQFLVKILRVCHPAKFVCNGRPTKTCLGLVVSWRAVKAAKSATPACQRLQQ